MPSEKGRPPTDDASQTTITLRQMATELADSHDISKKQAEALLDDLMTLAIRHIKNGSADRSRHPARSEATAAERPEPTDRRSHPYQGQGGDCVSASQGVG